MPALITSSTEEVGMDLGPEDRAIARSDEPEARSAARWRGRAARGIPEGIAERWPALASNSIAIRWLVLQQDIGRSPRTVEAYARSLVDYLGWCDRAGVDALAAGRGEIAGYVRDLRERPGRYGVNVVASDLGCGVGERDAAAAGHGRAVVLRLLG